MSALEIIMGPNIAYKLIIYPTTYITSWILNGIYYLKFIGKTYGAILS